MKTGFFITGTDTDVGKTWVTVALLRRFRKQGLRAVGMKPVAAGCDWQDGKLISRDACMILENSSSAPPYQLVNPYAFEMPFSPHIACGDTQVEMKTLLAAFNSLSERCDVLLVEGAGGWLSPLGGEFDNATLAKAMALPVILVVGMRLGCINHARLTLESIRRSGVECAGWVAVGIVSDAGDFRENLGYLQHCLDARFLGVLPFLGEADFDFLASCLLL